MHVDAYRRGAIGGLETEEADPGRSAAIGVDMDVLLGDTIQENGLVVGHVIPSIKDGPWGRGTLNDEQALCLRKGKKKGYPETRIAPYFP